MTAKTIENLAFLQTCESMFGSEIIALFEGSNYLRMSENHNALTMLRRSCGCHRWPSPAGCHAPFSCASAIIDGT